MVRMVQLKCSAVPLCLGVYKAVGSWQMPILLRICWNLRPVYSLPQSNLS
jgi:hypothetical protein